MDFSRLPGGDVVQRGLRDLAESRDSEAADLVLIGAPRLRRLGLDVPLDRSAGAEHRLYLRLAAEDADSAHAQDQRDVSDMLKSGAVEPDRLLALFETIAPNRHRYPALDPESFRRSLNKTLARS